MARLAEFPGVVVRPWLQDFPDYQAGRQSYGVGEVRAQIDASEAGGGSGFMLWDPTLDYQFEALAGLRTFAAPWESSDQELADLLGVPVVVRPWLQDPPDYRAGRQSDGAGEVRAQIDASKAGGGSGLMLWGPSLDYQFKTLARLRPVSAPWEPSDEELADRLRFPDLEP